MPYLDFIAERGHVEAEGGRTQLMVIEDQEV